MEIIYEIKNLFNELKNKSGTRIINYLELYHELENYFNIEASDKLIMQIYEYYLESAEDNICDFVAEISRYSDNMKYAENQEEKDYIYDEEYDKVYNLLIEFEKGSF